MEVKIEVLKDKTPNILENIPIAVKLALEAIAEEAEGNAVIEVNKQVYDTAPSENYVRTGDLRKFITSTVDGNSAIVGDGIEYAPYVELGTQKMKARPFIKPALTNYLESYKKILTDTLSKKII